MRKRRRTVSWVIVGGGLFAWPQHFGEGLIVVGMLLLLIWLLTTIQPWVHLSYRGQGLRNEE